ncbi:MAG: biotin--[acetyl-CoA-carboxylase] ligase [Bacteroidota bacterium]
MVVKWIKLDKVVSTNSFVAELIKEEIDEEGLVVIAEYQEHGRGQGGHSWHSLEGENLLMSLLLYPAFLSASEQFQLSRVASLAICNALESMGVEPVIKWPNDILTGRGKIAGILLEHGITGKNLSHSIMGIGLNLNQSHFPDFPISATSLILEKEISTDPDSMAETLLEKISGWYKLLKEGRGEVLEQEYLDRLYMLDQTASFVVCGEEIAGMIRGVNNYGELQVEIEGRIQTFGHQEISLKV